MSVLPFDSSSCYSDHVYDFRPNCTSLSYKNHEKSNSFKKLIKGFRNNDLLAECTMLQKILKKANVWNSLENTCLNTWCERVAVSNWPTEIPCNVSQSGRFSHTREGRRWWCEYIKLVIFWTFRPIYMYRIASFKNSLTHVPSSL